MKTPNAATIHAMWLKELLKLQRKYGSGELNFYSAQQVWDTVRSRFPEGSINGDLAGRVFDGLQEDGSVKVAAGEGDNIGVRLTASGAEKLETKNIARRTKWLAYFGATTGGFSIAKTVVDWATQ